jgi:hypothetical protein
MADNLSATGQDEVPTIAKVLGGLGLLPFLAGTLFAIAGGPGWAGPALRYYAATILAFMGGIHWGLAIAGGREQEGGDRLRLQLVGSVIPSLIGWFALLMPATQGLTVMALAFALLLGADLAAVKRGGAPAWYPKLRMPLTAIVTLCLLIAAWL